MNIFNLKTIAIYEKWLRVYLAEGIALSDFS